MHFRAYILRGHMVIETKKDGYPQVEHSDTCACKKKAKTEGVKDGGGA